MRDEILAQREGQPEPNSDGGTGGGAVLDVRPCSPLVYCEADLKNGRTIKAEHCDGAFRFSLKNGRKTRKIELTDDEAWVVGQMISAMHPKILGSSNPLWHRIQEQRRMMLDRAKAKN